MGKEIMPSAHRSTVNISMVGLKMQGFRWNGPELNKI